jgi:mono/diheme cytochrome c family protein
VKAVLGLAAAALFGGALVIYAGWYNISADQHLRPTYALLEYALRRAVRQHAEDVVVPEEFATPQNAARGFALYRTHCAQCHGAPGVAPEPFALGMRPAPTMLSHVARERTPAQLYWVVKRGIKMTGMPAWEFRMSEDDLWSTVAFLLELPKLSPAQYAALRPGAPARPPPAPDASDASRGRQAIEQYACVTCHAIPGIVGPNAPVGPPLAGIGSRLMLGGVLPNTPENMVRWLRAPQQFAPGSAMPDLGVTEHDARDIAAYLATLK